MKSIQEPTLVNGNHIVEGGKTEDEAADVEGFRHRVDDAVVKVDEVRMFHIF